MLEGGKCRLTRVGGGHDGGKHFHQDRATPNPRIAVILTSGHTNGALTRLTPSIDPHYSGFTIPINIRVTDANDNAPRFLNAPYVLNISEVTVIGTRVLQGVRAEDDDQQGPYSTVRYSVLSGPHSEYFKFENELEGTLVLNRPLDYEFLKNFAITVRAQDQGNPPLASDTVIQVNIIDADDQNPIFVDDRYNAFLPDPPLEGVQLRVQPRDIAAYDQDTGINASVYYSFNFVNADYGLFDIRSNSGQVLIKRDIKNEELLQPSILVIRATQQDNPDRYALATLAITRLTSTTRVIRFLQRIYHIKVPENIPGGSVIATLSTSHIKDDLRYYVSDQHLLEVFTINSNGELTLKKQLDYETRDSYVFKVFVTDGKTNDSSVVNISVINENDWEPRFRYPQYEFFINENPILEENSNSLFVGLIEAADGDKGDEIHLSLSGPNANMFTVNSLGEVYVLLPLPKLLHNKPIHLTAIAVDSGHPSKKTSVPVTIHMNTDWSHVEDHGDIFVILVFGSLLALLIIIIVFLVAYIYKSKYVRNTSNYGKYEKTTKSNNPAKMDNPMFGDSMLNPRISTATNEKPGIVYKKSLLYL
ncbi:Cadherin 96Cb [Carabus blaptoides fortunei]